MGEEEGVLCVPLGGVFVHLMLCSRFTYTVTAPLTAEPRLAQKSHSGLHLASPL